MTTVLICTIILSMLVNVCLYLAYLGASNRRHSMGHSLYRLRRRKGTWYYWCTCGQENPAADPTERGALKAWQDHVQVQMDARTPPEPEQYNNL